MRKILFISLILFALLQAFSMKSKTYGPPDKDSLAILRENRNMEKAFQLNDFLKVASFYADSAVMVGNKHEVKGREQIDAYWKKLENRGVSWQLENILLEVHGDVSFQRGVSRMKFLHNDKEHLSEVRFTLVWKKQEGEWKIFIDHYSLL